MLQVLTVWEATKQLFLAALSIVFIVASVSAFVFGVYFVLTSFSLIALFALIGGLMILVGVTAELHKLAW